MATNNDAGVRSLGHVLVTGGSGFLGNHIVSLLASRKACSRITVLDLKTPATPVAGVHYEQGDLTDYDAMIKFYGVRKFDAVIHTASPVMTASSNRALMRKVNVEGTRVMLQAAQETGVTAFVYTSSASVVHDTQSDLINADESYPLIMGKDQPEYYTTTKAEAELLVLAANRSPQYPKFLTTSLRPSGMFGEGDVQMIPPMLGAYFKGQTKFQLGENENLFDFTEITNVAHAHHLATAALLATAERDSKGLALVLDHEKVDGEAFFITNDSPVYFWDFTRMIWSAAGDKTTPEQVWKIPKDFGLFLASLMEWIFFIFRLGKPNLTRQQVRYSSMTRYFNIDKAKRRLGYTPLVGLQDGIKRGVADAIYRGVAVGQPPELKGKKIQ